MTDIMTNLEKRSTAGLLLYNILAVGITKQFNRYFKGKKKNFGESTMPTIHFPIVKKGSLPHHGLISPSPAC